MKKPKENKRKPRDRTPKSTAGTIPKAALKAVWLKTKEQARTAARENDTESRQQEPTDLAGSAAEQSAAFVWHQGRKFAETQARQHRQRRLLPAPTPPVSAVSARNRPSTARCPMRRNARAVGQICPDSGRKKKPSPPKPRRAIFAALPKVSAGHAPPRIKLCAV